MFIRELKAPCARCHSTGRLAGVQGSLGIAQINASGLCPQCNGRGFLLTPLGEDLLHLLRPFVEEWIAERDKAQPNPRPAAPSTP